MKTLKYQWKSVAVGGGGFVPGIIFHPKENGLVYLRTDMGGAYRRDKNSKEWVCLTDMFGKADAEYNGVLSMAVDPVDTNAVYMMNGKYTNKDACLGAFHASDDRGLTWKRTMLPFKVGGNEMGRGCGERLAVNPLNSAEILMGTTTSGLWRSSDKGESWSHIKNLKEKNINFAAYRAVENRLLIFVAAVDTSGSSLNMSEDKGKTWKAVPGQPSSLMAIRADFAGNFMYATFSCSQGPYGITRGAFWKYDLVKRAWTDLRPPAGGGGFSGVSVDAQNPDRIIVSTLNRANPFDEIYRSTDGGRSWVPLIVSSKWDKSGAGYTKTMHPHWMADIKIDPFDGERALFVTGYGIWTSRDLSSGSVTWFFDNKGLEETVPLQLISPDKGAHLLSAMGDIDGFKHDSLVNSPAGRFNPWAGTTLSIAFAENEPLKIVKAFNSKPPFGAYSNDGGINWHHFKSYPMKTSRGGLRSIAISCDGRSIVWAPKGAAISYSHDSGVTWDSCRGKAKGSLWPFADRVNPDKFYLYDGVRGILYLSSDKGVSFYAEVKVLSKEKKYPGGDGMAEYSATSAPGREGDVWLAAGKAGLYHFTRDKLKRVKGVTAAFRAGFGKAKTKGAYPAIYIWAAINKVTGFFRSDNEGKTWSRINDDLHQYGWIHDIIGDPRIFGRCYIGVEGRGILFGQPKAQVRSKKRIV